MNSVISQSVDSLLPLAQEQGNKSAAIEGIEAKSNNVLPANNDKEADKKVDEDKVVSLTKSVEEEPVDQEKLTDAISVVSEFMNQPPRNINFLQAENSGKTIVQIFDAESKELIKQFPSEKIIDMAEKINNLHQEILQKSGMIIDDVV